MATRIATTRSTGGKLNFARDRQEGSEWCNHHRRLTTQKLLVATVELHNADALEQPVSILREGLEKIAAPIRRQDHDNAHWMTPPYLPHCCTLL